MAIHIGTLIQIPVPRFMPDAYNEARLSLLNFLAQFGWTDAARVGDWNDFLGNDTTQGIVLSHPKWGSIYWGSVASAGYYMYLGISSSDGSNRIRTSQFVDWINLAVAGSVGPSVIYIEHSDYVVLKISTSTGGGMITGNMFFVSTGSYQFVDHRAFSPTLEQSDYFFPTTRYTSSLAEDILIGLSKNVLRKFSAGSDGFIVNQPLSGLATYSYGSVLPVGEYLINGKRYYQFSTNLYVLVEI